VRARLPCQSIQNELIEIVLQKVPHNNGAYHWIRSHPNQLRYINQRSRLHHLSDLLLFRKHEIYVLEEYLSAKQLISKTIKRSWRLHLKNEDLSVVAICPRSKGETFEYGNRFVVKLELNTTQFSS